MARRILSADSALLPRAQDSLESSVRTEGRGGFLQQLQLRWYEALRLEGGQVLFDWDDRSALMSEIAFINQAREKLDETAVKLAPSMLRIVLTVKAHLPEPRVQRAFLAEHVDWDFRRISELCIVADSYRLLDPRARGAGEDELRRYGWSCALKLAYVREPGERQDLWERAGGLAGRATYRAVLEELRRFRERKLIGPPVPAQEIGQRLSSAREGFAALDALADGLPSREECRQALRTVGRVQKELGRLKRVLRERIEASAIEDLAASV